MIAQPVLLIQAEAIGKQAVFEGLSKEESTVSRADQVFDLGGAFDTMQDFFKRSF